MSTTVYIPRYSFIQLNQLGRQWRERKCPIFETVANGVSNAAHVIASPVFHRWATALHGRIGLHCNLWIFFYCLLLENWIEGMGRERGKQNNSTGTEIQFTRWCESSEEVYHSLTSDVRIPPQIAVSFDNARVVICMTLKIMYGRFHKFALACCQPSSVLRWRWQIRRTMGDSRG